MKPYYQDDKCTIYNDKNENVVDFLPDRVDLLFLDPPYDIWHTIDPGIFPESDTIVAFSNPQNRYSVYELFGKPKWELVWYYTDGTWYSHNGPRSNHDAIMVYGNTGEAYVGPINNETEPRKPYHSGLHGQEEYVYVPRERKLLRSVLEYPKAWNRIGRSIFGKPEALIMNLLEWVAPETILDPFMGSGTTLRVAKSLNQSCIGIEMEQELCDHAVKRLAQEVLPL